MLVMIPATFCAGITLPLITRTLVLGGLGERAIGTVYAVNTLGSIIGVSIAALVLMPHGWDSRPCSPSAPWSTWRSASSSSSLRPD